MNPDLQVETSVLKVRLINIVSFGVHTHTINYIFLFWLRARLKCGKWQGFRFSHYFAARFGSECRAAKDLDSCTSVAPISVILSWSAHETPTDQREYSSLRKLTWHRILLTFRCVERYHTCLGRPKIQFDQTLQRSLLPYHQAAEWLVLLTNKTPHKLQQEASARVTLL